MLSYPKENKVTRFIKLSAFWLSLLTMLWLFVLVFHDEIKIPKREIALKIDITNKVNICLPEDDEIFKETFFGF